MKILFLKAHVSAYTKKDGTFVAAHEDTRPSAKKEPAKPQKPAGRTADKLEAGGFTESAYAGTSGDPATKIYGYKENVPGSMENYFGGIFASGDKNVAESHGKNMQEFRYKPDALLDDDGFRDAMYSSDEGPAALEKVAKEKLYETLPEDEFDDLIEFLVGDKNINDDDFVSGNDRLGDILGYHEDYEIDFALQGLRGEIARRLGYSVVEMPDEHGTSLLVLGGDGVDFVSHEALSKAASLAQPTPAQAAAGNYKKRRFYWRGIEISIEQEKGSVRSGVDPDGNKWSVTMKHPYGYLRRTLGVDGDQFDCFIGHNMEADNVYVVTAMTPGRWSEPDEQKAMIGFDSEAEARAAFKEHYDDDRFLGSVKTMTVAEFVAKVKATNDNPSMIKAMIIFRK